ncbi:MAG: protein kinase domain-containing protein [Myxococcaceae bacterium]
MESIGGYSVDRLLARGGMAEVFLARTDGPGGFSKRLVLKRILPAYAEDPHFVELFLNEARLAAMLSHPNVVTVFDFGEENGSYFLAMEYVDGASVRELIRSLRRQHRTMPPVLAARMLIGFCEGLHYAHERRDESGQALHIVHRDVSPDNLLVTSAGVPKIVDFGIAKARNEGSPVTDGEMKGKYMYMPADLLRGGEGDRQVDVYALGVSLFEMVTGTRPYPVESEIALIQKILEGNAPYAHERNLMVPLELSEIIHKAMSPKKEERYATCREVQVALEEFLIWSGQRVTHEEIAHFVMQVMQERTPPRGAGATALGAPSLPDRFAESLLTEPSPWPGRSEHGLLDAELLEDDEELPSQTFPVVDTVEPPEPHRLTLLGGLLWTVGIGVGALVTLLTFQLFAPIPWSFSVPPVLKQLWPDTVDSKTPSLGPSATLPVRAWTPPEFQGDEAEEAVGEEAAEEALAATPEAPRERISPQALTSNEEVVAPVTARPKPKKKELGDGFLTVRSDPWCDVFIDGQKVGSTPLSRLKVPAGKHTLLLRNEDLALSQKLTIRVAQGAETKKAVIFPEAR